MANDFSGYVWLVDTVMASPYKGPVTFTGIWTKQVAAGDRLRILDGNGKVMFDVLASGANANVAIPRFQTGNGFQVDIIGSGLLQLSPHKA